jgi:hypothetical protein
MINFNDGYTEEFGENIHFRRLLRSDRERIRDLVLDDKSYEADKILFKPPYVFARWPIQETIKKQLFIELMKPQDEEANLRNLIDGVRLYCEQPLLAVRDCKTCREWWFDEETGKISQAGGRDLVRPKKQSHGKVSCETDRGCAKGHYDKPKGLSDRNWEAVNHYVEWSEVGCPHPECPVMRRNWKWIGMFFKKHGHPAIHAGSGISSAG